MILLLSNLSLKSLVYIQVFPIPELPKIIIEYLIGLLFIASSSLWILKYELTDLITSLFVLFS